jgi:Txe/YoeB family toxin of Txe-Axe toxin-antitoxin module
MDKQNRAKIREIIEELETKPYQGSYGQHPLWDYRDKTNECVVWSAEIDNENRINYLIFKYQNYILITNIGGHKVIDSEYSIRPKI